MKYRIRFVNFNESQFYLQVDPWAGIYELQKGEAIELEAESQVPCPIINVAESGDTRILTLWDSNEYFVIKDGKRVHWTQFQSNVF